MSITVPDMSRPGGNLNAADSTIIALSGNDPECDGLSDPTHHDAVQGPMGRRMILHP